MERAELIAAVREALTDHPCRFDIDEAVVSQLVVMLETVGEGNIQRGIQRVLKNHEWLIARRGKDPEYSANHRMITSMRETSESVAKQLLRGVAWVIVLAIAFLLVFGVRMGLIKAQ